MDDAGKLGWRSVWFISGMNCSGETGIDGKEVR